MRDKLKKWQGQGVTLLLSLFLLFAYYGNLFKDINNYYYGISADDLKNYYTVIYHIRYDQSYHHFEGMNYPYGEQVIFTDNQPMLSNFLKSLSVFGLDLGPYAVGIMNVLMLFSIVGGALLLYLLFSRLKLPWWYAAPVAVCIAFLSPQITRMGGHYALSYGFVIPLYLLLLQSFFKRPTFKKSLVIGLIVFLLAGIHMYYFGMAAFFFSLVLGVDFLRSPGKKKVLRSSGHFLLQVVLPFLLLQMWLWITDPVQDRPTFPYGFLLYKATWESIFLPVSYPFGHWIKENFYEYSKQEWFAVVYIGLTGSLICVALVLGFIYRAIIGQFFGAVAFTGFPILDIIRLTFKVAIGKLNKAVAFTGKPFLDVTLWASIPLVFFSIGAPFIWGMEDLLEFSGPIRQFRGIARFAWVFYYTINLVGFYLIFRWVSSLGLRWKAAYLLLILPIGWMSYEGWHFNAGKKPKDNRIVELEQEPGPDHWTKDTNPEDYQAILPLPYFHAGAEDFWRQPQPGVLKEIFIASLQTGLPIAATQMSRTSRQHVLNLYALIQEPFLPAVVLDDLPSEKPFLLWVMKGKSFTGAELEISQAGELVSESPTHWLRKLPVSYFRERQEERVAMIEAHRQDTNLFEIGRFIYTDSVRNFMYKNFEDLPCDTTYRGSGARHGMMKHYTPGFEGILPFQEKGDYVFTAWVYIGRERDPRIRYVYEQQNAEGKVIDYYNRAISEVMVLADGDWALIEHYFHIDAPDSKLKFSFHQDTRTSRFLYIDDVLLKPAKEDLYFKDPNILCKNSRFYKK